MQLQKAQRHRAKIKMALQGPSSSGKSFSALQVAFGLCGDWSKVTVVDTENGSANLYSHLGNYYVIGLSDTFSPERYIQAIETCEKAGMEVIILDSVTHEWEYLLDYHASLQGNSFTNWSKVTPRHNAFVQKILSSSCHIICTVRTKTDYVMNEKNGKLVPEKVGLKSVQRDGLDYEMTLVFDLDIKNNALASKDRTGLFYGKPEQRLSAQDGKKIADWCNSGSIVSAEEVNTKIGSCKSIQELLTLYRMYPQYQEVLKKGYEQKKRELILLVPDNRSMIAQLPISSNGVHK
jgi:hypothetical protein